MANATTGADGAAAADPGFDFKLYRYTPDETAAIVSAAIFAILTVLHFWRIIRHKSYYFLAFAIGGIFELIGYVARIFSHRDQFALTPYIAQSLLILLAPALFAASIYAILGHLIIAVRGDHLALIKAARTTKIFVGGDVVSFLLQMTGGGLQSAGTLEMYHLGEKIILAGLFIQMAFFSFFIVCAIVFHIRLSRQPPLTEIPWNRHLNVLYAVSVVILVRNLFRVVEYLQGNGGYLVSHEIFLYIFDMALMAAVMLMFLVWYVDDLRVKQPSYEDGDFTELTTVARSERNVRMK